MSITNKITSGISYNIVNSISRRNGGFSDPGAILAVSSLGLAYDAAGGTLLNTKASVANVVDWEGVIRPTVSNEIRFRGGRRVINSAASRPHDWSEVGATGTDNGDGTDTISALVDTGDYVRVTAFSGSVENKSFRYSVEVKGSGANVGKQVRIYLKRGGGGSLTQIYSDVYLTDDWQDMTIAQFNGSTSQVSIEIRIGGAASNIASEVDVRGVKLEEVTGQTNQSPSPQLDFDEVQNSGLTLIKYYNNKPLPYSYVTVYGDSYTDESDELGSNLQNYMGLTYHSSGVSGETLSQIRARMVAEAPYLTTDLVLLEGGANDIFAGGADPNTVMRTQMGLMTDHAISESLSYVVFTIPPNSLGPGDGYTADMQSYLESYNAWLISTYPDNYVDMYTLLEDPASPGDLNPIYDEGDRIHSNAAAFRVVDRATEELLSATVNEDLDAPMQIIHEPAVTNLMTDPTDATQAGWTHSENVAAYVDTTAPDGSAVSVSITPSVVSGLHYTYNSITTTSGEVYANSHFFKPNGYDWVQIVGFLGFSGTSFQNYNVSTGALGESAGVSAADVSIEKYTNGWCRCVYRDTATATGSSAFGVLPIATDSATRAPSFSGDASAGILMMSSQAEPDNATSFTTVARVIDNIYIAQSVGTNIKQEQGALMMRMTPKYDKSDQVGDQNLLSLKSSGSSMLIDSGSSGDKLGSYDGSGSSSVSASWSSGDNIIACIVWDDAYSEKSIAFSDDNGATWGSWVSGAYDGAWQTSGSITYMEALAFSADLDCAVIFGDLYGNTRVSMQNWLEQNAGGYNCASAQFP